MSTLTMPAKIEALVVSGAVLCGGAVLMEPAYFDNRRLSVTPKRPEGQLLPGAFVC